jgi:hypothetical protein
MNESSISFDQKFKSVYKSFELSKSKIGQTKITKKNDSRYSKLDDIDDMNVMEET